MKAPCPLCPRPGAFSPSQIKAFEFGCQRKWAFRHIADIEEPSFGFQELGKEVHRHLEDYLRHGTMPAPGSKAADIALAGIPTLPKPHPGHIIEEHLHLEVDDILFHGFADLIPHDEYAVDDHKTTADFKYALTPAELRCDPQALIYAMWVRHHRPRDELLHLRWRYYRTKGAHKTLIVETYLSPGELDHNFERYVLEPARRMRDIRAIAELAGGAFDVNTLPPSPGSCNAYGGCPHKVRCSLHKSLEPITMGSLFRDKLKAGAADDKPTEPDADKPRCSPCPVCCQEPCLCPKPDTGAVTEVKDAAGETVGLVPQEHKDEVENILAEGVVPPDAPAPVAELPEEKPKRRARVIKAKAEPSTRKDDREHFEDYLAEATPKLVLGINTMPSRCPVKLLSDVLQPIVQDLSEQLGVTHYRLAKEAEYGRADALLLSAFKEAAPVLTGYIYADKRDADSAAVLGYLEAQAVEVFRGAY